MSRLILVYTVCPHTPQTKYFLDFAKTDFAVHLFGVLRVKIAVNLLGYIHLVTESFLND